MPTPIQLSVIVPFYNGQKNVIEKLSIFKNFFDSKDFEYELIIVNDGSNKNLELLEKKIIDLKAKYISLPKNMGKGYAIRKGIQESLGTYVFFADADHSTPIEFFDLLYENRTEADIIIGSRYIEGSLIVTPQPILRKVVSWFARQIIGKILLKGKVVDSQCGFKMFEGDIAREIVKYQKVNRWAFDAEILAISIDRGYKIKEVPVNWNHEKFSQIRSFPDSWKTFIEVLRIKRNLSRKVYTK